jgi:hypothetical protein
VTAIRLLAGEPPERAGLLYRAWRPDVEFPFVEVVAHEGAYAVVHEDGSPDGAEGVTLVEPFDVPAGEEERFLEAWRDEHERHAEQRGYLGARLYRCTGPAEFRFVEIARWSSPLMVSRARAPGRLYKVMR